MPNWNSFGCLGLRLSGEEKGRENDAEAVDLHHPQTSKKYKTVEPIMLMTTLGARFSPGLSSKNFAFAGADPVVTVGDEVPGAGAWRLR